MPTGAIDDTLREAARALEPDRYTAALLSPRHARAGLIALAAFAGDVRRIPFNVREPALGAIRLQWWRDAIETGARDGERGPLAAALAALMAEGGLDRSRLLAVIDAREEELYSDPIWDEETLFRHLDACEGNLFRLAVQLIDDRAGPGGETLLRAAGAAYGLMRVLSEFPRHLQKGRIPLPAVWLAGLTAEPAALAAPDAGAQLMAARNAAVATVRSRLAQICDAQRSASRATRLAILPAALIEPHLRVLERHDHDLLRHVAEVAPLTRVWRLWRARRAIAGS